MCHSEYFSHKNTFILCRVYIRENPVRFNIRQSKIHLKFILRPVPCQLGLLLSLCDTSRYCDEIFFLLWNIMLCLLIFIFPRTLPWHKNNYHLPRSLLHYQACVPVVYPRNVTHSHHPKIPHSHHH